MDMRATRNWQIKLYNDGRRKCIAATCHDGWRKAAAPDGAGKTAEDSTSTATRSDFYFRNTLKYVGCPQGVSP